MPTFPRLMMALLLGGLLVAPLQAHGMRAKVEVVDNQVTVTVSYDDDESASGATVELFAEGNSVPLLKGVTDRKGQWIFDRPPPGQYRIVAEEEEGHRAERKFQVLAGENSQAIPEQNDKLTSIVVGIGTIVMLGLIAIWSLRKPRPDAQVNGTSTAGPESAQPRPAEVDDPRPPV
jgi:hypothetical protein